MGVIGDTFAKNVNDGDPEQTKKIASAYQSIVQSCQEAPLQSAITRLNEEVLENLNRKLAELKPILVSQSPSPHPQAAIETRKQAKMDYDHYYFKLEQMRNKPNSDPNKVIRVALCFLFSRTEPEQVPGVSDDTHEHHRPSDRQVHRVRDRSSHLPRLRVPDAAFRAERVLLHAGAEHGQVQGHATPRGRADGSAGGSVGGFAGRSRRAGVSCVFTASSRSARTT